MRGSQTGFDWKSPRVRDLLNILTSRGVDGRRITKEIARSGAESGGLRKSENDK